MYEWPRPIVAPEFRAMSACQRRRGPRVDGRDRAVLHVAPLTGQGPCGRCCRWAITLNGLSGGRDSNFLMSQAVSRYAERRSCRDRRLGRVGSRRGGRLLAAASGVLVFAGLCWLLVRRLAAQCQASAYTLPAPCSCSAQDAQHACPPVNHLETLISRRLDLIGSACVVDLLLPQCLRYVSAQSAKGKATSQQVKKTQTTDPFLSFELSITFSKDSQPPDVRA